MSRGAKKLDERLGALADAIGRARTQAPARARTRTVPPEKFGRDHFSTLLYLEHCAVESNGVPDLRRMRGNQRRHPGLAVPIPGLPSKEYPTRLRGGALLEDHDDWDCADDMEAAGWLRREGTGMHPIFVFTDDGFAVASALRRWKADGGRIDGFVAPTRSTP